MAGCQRKGQLCCKGALPHTALPRQHQDFVAHTAQPLLYLCNLWVRPFWCRCTGFLIGTSRTAGCLPCLLTVCSWALCRAIPQLRSIHSHCTAWSLYVVAGNAALLVSERSRGLHIHDNTQAQFSSNSCTQCTAELDRMQSQLRRSETACKRLLRSLALSGTGPTAASDWAIEPHCPCHQAAQQPKVG